MKFLVDAQLPRRLATALKREGHDAVHTLELQNGNRTSDLEIIRIADAERRVVVTKDADFVNSYHITGKPKKLLLISTGNINNADLEALFTANLPAVVAALTTAGLVELTRSSLITHQ